MRKLASIKQISNLIPIEGKDRIELAIVDGWSVIVKKNEFSVGSKCVYCEIDSVLPDKPEFEFLRSNGFRIKTMKMSGVISQGICFPINILPEAQRNLDVGTDVTEIIGVVQYEKTMDKEPSIATKIPNKHYPKFLMKFNWFRTLIYKFDHKGSKTFPDFISKTDETRIQNMPWILSTKAPFVATEKVDGQSGSFALVKHDGIFGTKFEYIVCSRNLRLYNKDTSSYWNVSDRYNIESVLKNLIGNHNWVAIQGECVAPGVQGNKYKVTEPDLYVFNLIYPDGRVDSISANTICESNGLKFVPIIDKSYILPDTVDEVLKFAHGKSKIGDTLREGVVFRDLCGKQSFKAVDPLFLLKYDE